MTMLRVGIVGWRGMVGSVLVQRMREERDFDHVEPVFFSTSQAGGKGPSIGKTVEPVGDANDIEALKKLPVIISCQGGDYTNDVYPKLRSAGWKGYWIDAARARRICASWWRRCRASAMTPRHCSRTRPPPSSTSTAP